MKATIGGIRALYQSIVLGNMEIDDVVLPEIVVAQQIYDPPMKAPMSSCGLWNKSSYIWIPEKEDPVKL